MEWWISLLQVKSFSALRVWWISLLPVKSFIASSDVMSFSAASDIMSFSASSDIMSFSASCEEFLCFHWYDEFLCFKWIHYSFFASSKAFLLWTNHTLSCSASKDVINVCASSDMMRFSPSKGIYTFLCFTRKWCNEFLWQIWQYDIHWWRDICVTLVWCQCHINVTPFISLTDASMMPVWQQYDHSTYFSHWPVTVIKM